jgi:hypothetical protein
VLAGEHLAGALAQADEQVELRRRQVHLRAVARDPAGRPVDVQRTELERPGPAPAEASSRARSTRRSSARTRATSSRMPNGLVR